MESESQRIKITGLSAGYNAQALCRPLDLEIVPGQGLGIIGANGSGKSTILRSIFDLQIPLTGTVEYRGVALKESSAMYRRDLALLVEDGSFFDELTVAEHLSLVARGHGLKNPQQAVERELEFFQLLSLSDTLPHELSSGERRKLLLAASLIRPAKFLVLDEPEQRLDPLVRQRLAQRLETMRMAGTGLVLVSHDRLLIGRCTQKSLLLAEGEWRLIDTSEAVSWLGGR